jgi:hypothetical protein
MSFRPSNWPPKLKTAKNSKLPKLPENCFEPVGEGGWPPISTWISKEIHVEHSVHAKERGNVELKIIITHNLDDGVRSITEWTKLLMGPCKVFFLQMQPNFVSHLKRMWHPVLIMALLVLGVGLL